MKNENYIKVTAGRGCVCLSGLLLMVGVTSREYTVYDMFVFVIMC